MFDFDFDFDKLDPWDLERITDVWVEYEIEDLPEEDPVFDSWLLSMI